MPQEFGVCSYSKPQPQRASSTCTRADDDAESAEHNDGALAVLLLLLHDDPSGMEQRRYVHTHRHFDYNFVRTNRQRQPLPR